MIFLHEISMAESDIDGGFVCALGSVFVKENGGCF